MGLESRCDITIDGTTAAGVAHLEPTGIRVNSPFQRTIPLADVVRAEAVSGTLVVEHRQGRLSLALGRAAQTWALRIRYPRGRLEKLGVKSGMRVLLRGLSEPGLVEELQAAGAKVATRAGAGQRDMIVVRLATKADLQQLTDLRPLIAPAGSIWAVWPKGRKELREGDVRDHARAHGLVDVKVMSFSDELSGLKLVIPVALR